MKYILLLFLILFVLCSCEKENGNETMISSYSDTESHNTGQNCMNCHRNGGDGEGWFTLAGSVFDTSLVNPYPNASIKLYTGPNGSGSEVKLIEVDGLGNFYTTESIDFGNGLYTSIINTNGMETFMNTVVNSGECNSCHGNNVGRIFTP